MQPQPLGLPHSSNLLNSAKMQVQRDGPWDILGQAIIRKGTWLWTHFHTPGEDGAGDCLCPLNSNFLLMPIHRFENYDSSTLLQFF